MSENSAPTKLWSQLGKNVQTPPPPTSTKPTQTAAKSSVKKNVTVFKSALGASKAQAWSDYPDDDSSAPTISSGPSDKRIAELESQLAGKCNQVNVLESTLQENGLRINQLEIELKARQIQINELNMEMAKHKDEFAKHIKNLENDKHQVELEKDALEQQVYELEDQLESLNFDHMPEEGQHDFQDQSKYDNQPPPEQLNPSDAVEHVVPESNDGAHKPEIICTPKKQAPDTAMKTSKKTTLQFSSEEFPVLSPKSTDDAQSTPIVPPTEPVFVEPQNLKPGPVVPPAPRLKLPLDMSKYGKKPASKPSASSQSKVSQTPPKRKVDPTLVPTIDTYQDVRKWSLQQREPLANGGPIDILMAKQVIGSVPKYMFMQCSHFANKHLTENSRAKSMTFPAGSMDTAALKTHLDWMNQLVLANAVFSVSLNPTHTDVRNINIMRAARVLGLNNCYVGHFTKQYCDRIRSDDLSYELMHLIAGLAYPDNDPVFECLANNIANQYQRNNVVDEEGLEQFLAEHRLLADRVMHVRKNAGVRKVRYQQRREQYGGANRAQTNNSAASAGTNRGRSPASGEPAVLQW